MPRSLLTVLLLASLVVIPLAAHADKVLGKGTTDGTFVGVEIGDYAHFMMKDTKGAEVSFFIVKGDGTVEKFVNDPDRYRGKKIRVWWKRVMANIPEAGGEMEILQVTSVKLR